MAKRKKGPMRKHIHLAAEAYKERRNHLFMLLAAALGGILLWALVSFVDGINTHTTVNSIIIFGATILVVIVIGEVGVRYSRFRTEYKKIKDQYDITDDMVKNYLKEQK